MQLARPFLRVPLAFDAPRLAAEVAQIPDRDWRPHPQGHPGNRALPLIAANGDPRDDGVAGPMRPVPIIQHAPYLRQTLAALAVPLGRTRLMKLDAQAEATPHIDTNYYWLQRARVHIPIVTSPQVRFLCGDAAVHMAAGDCWIFDTWRPHNVHNPTPHERIHLVVDTVGSATFWKLVNLGGPVRKVAYDPESDPRLILEAHNFPAVMSPWEIDSILARWMADAQSGVAGSEALRALQAELAPVLQDWRGAWAQSAASADAGPIYMKLAERLLAAAAAHEGRIALANGLDLAGCIKGTLVPALVARDLSPRALVPDGRTADCAAPRSDSTDGVTERASPPVARPPSGCDIVRPVIILSAPRSGSTLLFETLMQSPDVYTVGGESHRQIESVPELQPAARGYESNRLAACDVTPEVAAEVLSGLTAAARDREGRRPPFASPWRLLEKTPKNALRVPFLDALFPDALYIYLYREPEETIASLIEGWESGRFVMYADLPGWTGPPWSYLLVPEWRNLAGQPLPAIAAAQWRATQEHLLDDLASIPGDRVWALSYYELLADPKHCLADICQFAGLSWDRDLPGALPLSSHTVTPPEANKWRGREQLLAPHLPALRPCAARARAFVAACRAHARPRVESAAPARPPADAPSTRLAATPMSSVHTSSLPELLRLLRMSLLVTTYQAGKLIVVRADGAAVNTHFVALRKPTGLCADANRMFVGTESGLREFRNIPEISARLEPPGRHDAVYVFRGHHVTGNIDVHEMALGRGQLWYVNTRFSCLCTLDREHSFVPRWRPRFVSALAPEDRCHLNGLALADGLPRFLTALGACDTPEGWRANKRDGGVLLDYASGDVVAGGLSMPHSPRWHRDRLWFLESGKGTLATVDLASGKVDTVARLPGFTRGLDFAGPLAFVGLSQLREPGAFDDVPVTHGNERVSGVWVVNVETGDTVAFLNFRGIVQEIFTVHALAGALFPEILDEDSSLLESTFQLPDAALREVRFTSPDSGAPAPGGSAVPGSSE
ncbi:MAG: TIGR03032 family protein [Casimicrobiaceae bacterium]